MTPPGTMARVYQALKTRVMAGELAPGERIDPTRLSLELAASATPIREALQRLAGERLVESWQQEGFRQPFVTEASLRDLYGWSEEVLRVVLRAIERSGSEPPPRPDLDGDAATQTAQAFAWVAACSPNHEHMLAVASLSDRAHTVRLVEEKLFAEASAELGALVDLVSDRRWADARRWIAAYHNARLRRVPDIAASFRRRESERQ